MKYLVQFRRTVVEDVEVEVEATTSVAAQHQAATLVHADIELVQPKLNWDLQEDEIDLLGVFDT